VGTSSGTIGGSVIAVLPGGNGDVTGSRRVWRLERLKSQSIGSGVIRDGYLYLIAENGVACCLELKTGDKVWEERLKGPGAKRSSWSSMLLAGGIELRASLRDAGSLGAVPGAEAPGCSRDVPPRHSLADPS